MIFDPATLLPDSAHSRFVPYPNSSKTRGMTYLEYFYKSPAGEIFRTVARSQEAAEMERDKWLADQEMAAACRVGQATRAAKVAAIRAGHLNRSGMVNL